jgi:hypothetical protein
VRTSGETERERRKHREEDRRREGVVEIVRAKQKEEDERLPAARDRDGLLRVAGVVVPAVLDWRTNAREMVAGGGRQSRGGRLRRPTGSGAGRGRRTGVLGGWVLVRFSRGKRRRGVRAASGWCIIDPSVCGLGKKRSLRLGPRKRRSDTSAVHEGEKETPPTDRSRRQILEMRSPLTRHAAALADESARRIGRSIRDAAVNSHLAG